MYIDLVSCSHVDKGREYLFQAPAWSGLKPSDEVIVFTRKGESLAKVNKVITIEENREEFDFIVEMAGATLPLAKVKSKVVYEDFRYLEVNNGTDKD